MQYYFSYFVEVAICLAVFYGLYYLAFRNNTFFRINRFYLLITLLISLIIPTLNISLTVNSETSVIYRVLEPIIVTSGLQAGGKIGLEPRWQIIQYLYISGTFIFLMLFIIRVTQIIRLIRRHKISKVNGVNLVEVNSDMAPASFFNYVFFPAGEDAEEIMSHEEVHIKQAHTCDHLFFELVTVFMWFNPMVWIYRSSLRNVHEYLADEEVLVKGCDKLVYQKLLIEKSFGYRINELAINFNYSPLKKRLIMMIKNKSNKNKKWQYALILPLLAATMFYFGCESKTEATNSELKAHENIEAFDEVDVMPEYKGGINEFRKYVAQNLTYPSEAKDLGITGKIYVKFVVDGNGKVINPRIERSDISQRVYNVNTEKVEVVVVGYGEENTYPENIKYKTLLEEEALRVISSIPDFEKPGYKDGEKVAVYFTMPISFALQ